MTAFGLRRQRFPRDGRQGLTLIELTAAVALTVLLTAALSGVLVSLARHDKALREKYPDPSWGRRLKTQLEWDLAQSRRQRLTDDRITLVGYHARDPESGAALQRPTQVDYSIEEIGARRCLIRREASLDALSNDPPHYQLVCLDVQNLHAEAVSDPTAAPGSVPLRLHVQFSSTGETAAVLFDHILIVP